MRLSLSLSIYIYTDVNDTPQARVGTHIALYQCILTYAFRSQTRVYKTMILTGSCYILRYTVTRGPY